VRKPRRPDPDVHESDYRVPAALGTLAWTVALVVLVLLGDGLPATERWWIGVCVTGIVLGVFGFLYIPWLLRRRGGAGARRDSDDTGTTTGAGTGTADA
jgi:hypothetical protein